MQGDTKNEKEKTRIIHIHKSEQFPKLFHLNSKILNTLELDYILNISTETTKNEFKY